MATVHEDMKTDPQGYLDRIVEFVGAAPVTLEHQHLQRVLTSEALTQPRSYYWTRGALRLAEWSKAHAASNCVRRQKNRGLAALCWGRSGVSGSASRAASYAARVVPAGGGATGRDVESGFVGVEVRKRGRSLFARYGLSRTWRHSRSQWWNAGFARGADEGVRPYTCAWLRLCGTAEAACPYVDRCRSTAISLCWASLA